MEIDWLVTGCLLNNEKILDDKGKVKLHNSAPDVPTDGQSSILHLFSSGLSLNSSARAGFLIAS